MPTRIVSSSLSKISAVKSSPRAQKLGSFWQEFRAFAFQGNLIDLGVGLVLGASFKEVITSFVENILMPPIGLLLGNADFSQLYVLLGSGHYDSLRAAREAGAPVLAYGAFLTQLTDFMIIALSVYLVLRFILRQKSALPAQK